MLFLSVLDEDGRERTDRLALSPEGFRVEFAGIHMIAVNRVAISFAVCDPGGARLTHGALWTRAEGGIPWPFPLEEPTQALQLVEFAPGHLRGMP